MATERTQLEQLRAEWVESLKLAVERPSKDAVDWLLAHGEPKRVEDHPELVVLEIRDRFKLGQSLTLTCGPRGLIASMEDEHARTFSYNGGHKFKQLIRAQKGWGVAFIDERTNALIISERATFEFNEDAKMTLEVVFLR